MWHFVLDARTAQDHFPGIGRYVSNLARAMTPLLAADERLTLLTDPSRPSRWSLPPVAAQVQQRETAVSPFSLAQQWQLPPLLRQLQADVYHSPYYLMPYRPGVPTVLTLYDLIPQLFPQTVSWRARLFFRLTTRLALAAAQQTVVISQATRQDVLATYGYPAERLTAVPLAPDPQFGPQSAAEIGRIRQQYGLPAQFGLYLGINKPHKNLVRLVQAWAEACGADSSTAVPLIIAGAWDERYPEVKHLAAQQPGEGIRFLGPVATADLPGLYAAATLFLFPSLYEGFGLPVIEAMACGTAVVCAHTSSLPEITGTGASAAALTFDPLAVPDMARQIGRALGDATLRATLQQRGLAQAAQFTWTGTAQATLHIYRLTASAGG